MTTAVDTAFEAIVTAPGEAPEELHAVCSFCYPQELFGTVHVVALCGYEYPAGYEPGGRNGDPKCVTCLARSTGASWPCGH